MPFEELIETLKHQFEAETGWGDSSTWTNQDFIHLSERINQRTGVTLSHVTLKRIWGKVKYDSLPNTYTLDTLAHYIGFENWRSFASLHKTNIADVLVQEPILGNDLEFIARPAKKPIWLIVTIVVVGTIISIIYLGLKKKTAKPVVNKADYKFSSKKVITSGLPNSVIFNYDATKAPGDSVVIQQSWNKALRTTVSKKNHQHTSIYYYPDYYKAKLIVNNRIVKQHELFIKSDGWLSIVEQKPVPVYFNKADVMHNGKISLPVQSIVKRNIRMQPLPPSTLFSNVQDFGEIYSDNFTFETLLRNDYSDGAAVCQQTNIYILCKGTAIGIPLCAKGCISNLELYFTDYYRSGKLADLSMFGVDFKEYVKVRIESHNKKAQVYLNNKLVYTVNNNIIHSKIVGIDYRFQGTGSVDYVRMGNGKVNFADEF